MAAVLQTPLPHLEGLAEARAEQKRRVAAAVPLRHCTHNNNNNNKCTIFCFIISQIMYTWLNAGSGPEIVGLGV